MENPYSYIESLKKTIKDQAVTEERLREQIHKLSQEAERLYEFKSEMEESFRFIMDEKCGNSEVHCACVPILRMKARVQQEEIENLSDQLAEREKEIEGWKNKWNFAVGMAAIAENKLDELKIILSDDIHRQIR